MSKDVDKKRIEEIVESLRNLRLAQSDFINNNNTTLLYDLIADLMQNDTGQKEPYKSVYMIGIEYKSDNDIIINLWDSMAIYAQYVWLSMVHNIDCKECIIDEMGVEYTKWVEYVWHEGTHFIRKENGNVHYDFYPAENYEKLLEEGVQAIHFGKSVLYDLYNELYSLYIYLEGAEGDQYYKLCNEIKQIENEIEAMKQKLEKIPDIEKSYQIYESMEKSINEFFK